MDDFDQRLAGFLRELADELDPPARVDDTVEMEPIPKDSSASPTEQESPTASEEVDEATPEVSPLEAITETPAGVFLGTN